jgi:hypothetical protein
MIASPKCHQMRFNPNFSACPHTIKCKKLHQIDIFRCYVVSHKVRYDQTQKCIKAATKKLPKGQQPQKKTQKLSSFVIDLYFYHNLNMRNWK